MIGDIWTVMWKEGHEYVTGGNNSGRGRGVLGVLIVVGIVSVLLPLQFGAKWFSSPVPVLIDGLYLPFTILLNVIADSFAGERERHTLETLLASRLSDRAILLGKIGAAVAYGVALSIVGALVQAVVANLVVRGAGLAFYPLGTVVAIVVLGLLVSLLAASAGCLVSLRASSTRQAQQILGIGFLVLIFAPIISVQLLPADLRAGFLNTLNTAGPAQILLVFSLILLVIDVVLILVTLARFQRAKLILD